MVCVLGFGLIEPLMVWTYVREKKTSKPMAVRYMSSVSGLCKISKFPGYVCEKDCAELNDVCPRAPFFSKIKHVYWMFAK